MSEKTHHMTIGPLNTIGGGVDLEHKQCLWCDNTFTPRSTGGHAQKFCSVRCREEFHEAGRAWVAAAVAEGRLSVADLKVAVSTCTLRIAR